MKILIEVTVLGGITPEAAMNELAQMILESTPSELRNGVNMGGEVTNVKIEHIL